MTRISVLKAYLWTTAAFTAAWWPLSHWFYPGWYHRLLGFDGYDRPLVTVIGTTGWPIVLMTVFCALNPARNRDLVKTLIAFSVLMAGTYVFLISNGSFPRRELANVFILLGTAVTLTTLYPWKQQ